MSTEIDMSKVNAFLEKRGNTGLEAAAKMAVKNTIDGRVTAKASKTAEKKCTRYRPESIPENRVLGSRVSTTEIERWRRNSKKMGYQSLPRMVDEALIFAWVTESVTYSPQERPVLESYETRILGREAEKWEVSKWNRRAKSLGFPGLSELTLPALAGFYAKWKDSK